jgi:L-lysine exporter family protein LysE/ArgO
MVDMAEIILLNISLDALLTGFFLGASLILAIGSQNAFVLRQGIIGQHVFFVALFCSLSDALLINIGVIGTSLFFNNFIVVNLNYIYGFSALWLFSYGIIRLKTLFLSKKKLMINLDNKKNLFSTLSIVAILTFANPHVYLDTVVLIGSVSQKFIEVDKFFFTLGACLSSFVFFFGLAYGAGYLRPIMNKTLSWKILDTFVAFVMFTIAFKLACASQLV